MLLRNIYSIDMIFVFLVTFLSMVMRMFVMQEVLDSSFSLSMQTSPDFIGRTKITLKTCHYFITEKYLVIFTTITCVCTTDERIQPTNQYPEQRYNMSDKDLSTMAFNRSNLVVKTATFSP